MPARAGVATAIAQQNRRMSSGLRMNGLLRCDRWGVSRAVPGLQGGTESRQPARRVVAMLGHDTLHQLDVGGAPGDHVELEIEALQIQPRDDADMVLLDEERA